MCQHGRHHAQAIGPRNPNPEKGQRTASGLDKSGNVWLLFIDRDGQHAPNPVESIELRV